MTVELANILKYVYTVYNTDANIIHIYITTISSNGKYEKKKSFIRTLSYPLFEYCIMQ